MITSVFRHFILILSFLLSIHSVWAQEEHKFQYLSTEQGLSQASVFGIAEDTLGFLWLATRDGLNKYDAHTFRTYNNNPNDANSLAGNYVQALIVDKQGTLWAGTTEGLSQYDVTKDEFITFRKNPDNPKSLKSNNIYHLYSDSKGKLWVGSLVGLSFMDLSDQGTFNQVSGIDSVSTLILEESPIWSIHEDRDGTMWVGSTNGMVKLQFNQQGKSTITTFQHNPQDQSSLRVNHVTSIIRDEKGILWVGTRDGGLHWMDEQNNTFQYFQHDSENAASLGHNDVRSIYIDQQGIMWIGTFNGLSKYLPTTQQFITYRTDPDNSTSISDNSIRPIFQDTKGTLWVGTYYGGVNMIDPHLFQFSSYKPSKFISSISHPAVSAMVEDKTQNIWIGTEGGGLNYFNPSSQSFIQYKHDPNDSKSLSSNNVKALFIDSNENLWVGLYHGGVNLLPKGSQEFIHFPPFSTIRDDNVLSIAEGKNGIIWIGTLSKRLSYYNPETKTFSAFDPNIPNTKRIDYRMVRDILFDSKQNLWIGTDKGLNVMWHDQEQFEHIAIKKGNHEYLVQCIQEDSEGQIWVGLLSGGLVQFEPKTKAVTFFDTKDGLAGNNVFGILEDSKHNLWISTNNGLSMFDPQQEKFTNYTIEDGLHGNSFNNLSLLKRKNNQMLFGGVSGFTMFHPDSIQKNNFTAPLVITDLKLFNKSVQINDNSGLLKANINVTKEITFTHKQNIFSIEFSLLNYINPEKNQYAYKLEGFENTWNYVQNPIATYTNLNAGEYIFKVKGANNDDTWNEEPTVLHIHILSPPWKTWWAYSLYAFIIAGIILLSIRFIKIRAKLKHDLALEHLEKVKQEEVHQLKLRFFTNISHEIRTPLTLILGPLENLLQLVMGDKQVYQQLFLIKSNANRLLRLVNQLLEFRKYETGNTELEVAEGNLVKFVKEIYLAFSQHAEQQNVNFKFEPQSEKILVWYDRDKLEKVLFNLLSNAFKFTPEQGTITMALHTTSNNAVVSVKNTGKGIDAAHLPYVFERFYQIEKTPVSGSGIGLALAKNIVGLHKGNIKVESDGLSNDSTAITTFSFNLPLGNQHFTAKQMIANFNDSESAIHYKSSSIENVSLPSPTLLSNGVEISKEEKPSLLLVEDNAEVRNFILSSFTKNYKVAAATNGAEGLEIAQKLIPDLIISDVMMPIMDGIEFCKKIKTNVNTSHIPVILLTARTSLIYEVSGLETGADDYITKPFNLTTLSMRVHNLISSRQQLRQKFSREVTLQPKNITITSQDEIFLEKALAIVEKNIEDESFNVTNFVREIGMSRAVLYKKIKALTDLSIIDFIKSVRLKKAAILLAQNQFMITDVAMQVGFTDPRYFRKCFRSEFGMTPRDYAAKHK